MPCEASVLVVEVSLVRTSPGESSPLGSDLTLLERWTFAHERGGYAGAGGEAERRRGQADGADARALEMPAVYKRAVVLLRSLYALLRALPAHRVHAACVRAGGAAPFALSHRLCRAPVAAGLPPGGCGVFTFASVDTPFGRLTGGVAHLPLGTLDALVPPAPPRAPPTSRVISDYAARGASPPAHRSWSRAAGFGGDLGWAHRPPPRVLDVDALAQFPAGDACGGGRGSAPVSIPRRPSESWLGRAEQALGGSPAHASLERRAFAASPRAGAASAPVAAQRAVGFHAAGGGAALSARNPHPSPPASLPFALTPSASSLAGGAHPLLARPLASPRGSSAGSPGDLASRFAAAMRRPSWSPASSVALSSSVAGLSPISPSRESSHALIQHPARHRNLAYSPDDAWLSEVTLADAGLADGEEMEAESLPFAIDRLEGDTTFDEHTASLSVSHSARADAAVGHLVRLLAEAQPLRLQTFVGGCSLKAALDALT